MTYAIRNKRTKKWVYGTDYRYSPWHQRTSAEKAILFDDYKLAKLAFEARKCGIAYEIVHVRIEAIERMRKEK